MRAARTDRVVVADLISDDATMDDGLVGPFRLHAASSARLSLRDGAIVDADGIEFDGHVEPGTEFYLRPPSGTDGVLVTATVPGCRGRRRRTGGHGRGP